MKQILLDDELYAEACRRAADIGFSSGDEYVIYLLQKAVENSRDDFDGFFTQERLAEIDRAAAQADAGKVMSLAEARERFRSKFGQ